MNLLKYASLFVFVGIAAGFATNYIRCFSVKNKLYDIPNNRSSHDTPKPKSGGLSIVLTLLLVISILSFFNTIDSAMSASLLIGLTIVAVIGLFDDYKSLSVLTRAVSYLLAAVFSLYLIGGFTTLTLNNDSFYLGSFGFLLSVLFVVWMTNLYNFMDGTDGFAAIQTICTSLFSGVLLCLSANSSYAVILFCLVASTMGFLYWNWAPAKIFMGDVGSCTIGFLFGFLAIYTEKAGTLSISVWLILLAPFVGDATFTLFKRMVNKEKWYKAHNSHAYQKLYQLGWTHRKLAIGLLATNTLIMWPFAYIANEYKNYELAMIILSYCVIGGIWIVVQNKYNKI